ncbi:TIGR02680 family protein [Bacillaceae bacterium W0354]
MINKWKMNRAGLLNFWYYDDEVFDFSNGKLLLRGSNGSGKSVTMQSFIPVLLDGKKSPDRLDPFGSKARRMEDYLLGEKEVVDREERTGYLFLEFKRINTDQYITIGIGLQAKRNKPMKFWGFIVNDNRRIGYDFNLYKYEQQAGDKQKIPCSRIELENLIGEGGHVVQTQSEYMKLVNQYVFGFETIEAYEDLIKLLIQLRSPKLSKDFRPTVIYEILESALPPLSDEDLRYLSDTIEQMDQTKQQIEQLERELAAISSLNNIYTTYNERTLADQANEYISTCRRVEKEEQLYKEKNEKLVHLDQTLLQLEEEIRDLKISRDSLKQQEERLSSHKVWNLEKERREQEDKFENEKKALDKKVNQIDQRKSKEIELLKEQRELEGVIDEHIQSIDDILLEMDNDSEDGSFTHIHQINRQDFERNEKVTFDFSVWKSEVNNHLKSLQLIEDELQQYEALKTKYQEKDKELADEQKKLDDVINQKQQWNRLFEEDKVKKLNEIYSWLEAAPWLEIDDKTLQEVSRVIYSLYEPSSYELVKQPFRQATFDFEQKQRQTLSQLDHELERIISELTEKQIQLQEWKAKKDPEPIIDPLTKEARQRLLDNKIPHVPFYAAVEFQDHVEPEVRSQIEAAIIDSGILNALIVDGTFDIRHDSILKPSPNLMAHTLADYLQPDLDDSSGISSNLVDDVLRSILFGDEDNGNVSINEQGQYRIGVIQGHAIPVNDVRYIGRNARKRYREEQIKLLQTEIESLIQSKENKEQEIIKVKGFITNANQRLELFPDDDDLLESFRDIEKLRIQIEQHQSNCDTLSDHLKQIHQQYTAVKRSIDEKTRSYNIELSLLAYREAVNITKKYLEDLNDLDKLHIKKIYDLKQFNQVSNRLEEIEEEIIELEGEVNIAQDQIETLQQNIKNIKEQLEQQGAIDIRKQINEVQQKLREVEENLEDKKLTKPRKEEERNQVKQQLEEKKTQLTFWKKMQEAWGRSFDKEVSLGLVEVDKGIERLRLAQTVLKQYGFLLKEKDSSKLLSQLTQEFYRQQTDLMEYRMSSFDASVKLPEWMNGIDEEDQLPLIENWKQKASRRIIELDYQGKQVNPYTVQRQFELEQVRQESFLDDQDKKLYEEILFNSVGQKLRARIRRAENWVKQMKGLMENRDTSSGLSFSIKWKPRTADTDEELDTIDLVQLLRQDPRLLKEEDLEKIITHFRSKISKAKDLMDNSSEMQTLLQVLKEVLDYRKWFSFVLYFQRQGENRRELTNHQFYKFSGGEKAMAMYIPLFTACYSRYLEADDHAPYIISLDEAFAGVDENNIREMFEIVEQLGFNYMMNSQVLWGDYDTISELSICELVRPKNADFVTVIRYHWDGKRLEIEDETEAIETKVRL